MAPPLSPTQKFLAPLAKLALRHPHLEGQAIWWENGEWQAQDSADDMIDGEEIAFYCEGLLDEGFGLHWQALADPQESDPVLVRLFLWQSGEAPTPPVDADWKITAEGRTAP